jgi:hypothetical protein
VTHLSIQGEGEHCQSACQSIHGHTCEQIKDPRIAAILPLKGVSLTIRTLP